MSFDIGAQYEKKPVRTTGRQGVFYTKRCPNAPADSGSILAHDGSQPAQTPQRVGRASVDLPSTRSALQREEEEGDQPMRVGRKPIEQPGSGKEHTYGVSALASVENSERFEHTQRHRTNGDIVGHRDDYETIPDASVQRGGRARAGASESGAFAPGTGLAVGESSPQEHVRGRQRTGYAPQGVGASPFATDRTEAESSQARHQRHPNDFNHGNVLTGGPMNSTKPKDKTPIWY